MMTFRALILPALLLSASFAGMARAADQSEARYVGLLADGTRIEGQQIEGWQKADQMPRLGSDNLLEPNRPLSWLCDRSLPPFEARANAAGYVEFLDGDRLPGRVVGISTSETASTLGPGPYLLIAPSFSFSLPDRQPPARVRVLARLVRRVVWEDHPPRELQPGTLFYRDGRRLSFRGLRWNEDAVMLLCDDGLRRVALADAAAVDLPADDPWDAYYETLAMLDGDCSQRLLQLETTDGLSATTTVPRIRPAVYGSDKDRANWYHMIQPAWSLDPLWVRFSTIRFWRSFPPAEVPLSRVQPVRSSQRSVLGQGWHWQADRNVQGGPLHGGDREYGWGFGVHATNELWFELPDAVQAFRARVGLDRLAGRGGCAQAMVCLDQLDGNPLYRSPLMIGSDQVIDVGTRSLSGPAAGQRLLGLVADAAIDQGPKEADPLDIRDTVDWFEPTVILDGNKLRDEVRKAATRVVAAWNGWTLETDQASPLQTRLNEDDVRNPRFEVNVATENRPLTLRSERDLGETDNWLLVHLWQAADGATPGRIELRLDGRPTARADVLRREGPPPWSIPLSAYRGPKRKLELVYTPADPNEKLCWSRLAIVERPTRADWTTLTPTAVQSAGGATTTVEADGSVLVGGEFPAEDTYTIACETQLPQVTAVRVEALPDASLPQNGPGRHVTGTFVLSQFDAEVVSRRRETFEGRYVRIELPSGEKPVPLTLAEVQVFSGAENVAIGGKATQSSTADDATAERAIDGNTNGNSLTSQSLSRTADEQRDPWWEVDLGSIKPIERIVIFNRTDNNFHTRLSNFRVVVLDEQRTPTLERVVVEPPLPSVEISLQSPAELPLASAAASFCREGFRVEDCLRNHRAEDAIPIEVGWSIGSLAGRPHAAVFTFEQPVDGRENSFVFRLKHAYKDGHQTLGRFRISVTGDKPPVMAEPVPLELPPLAE